MKFCVGYTNMLVSKNAKICVTPNAKHNICVIPTQNPNASQWNIGCVGSPMQNLSQWSSHSYQVRFTIFKTKVYSPYSTEEQDPTRMKSTQKKKEKYMANARNLRLGPNATYIPLTCVWVSRWGVTQILAFLDTCTNMLVFPMQNIALGVSANARTQHKCFCIAVECRLIGCATLRMRQN